MSTFLYTLPGSLAWRVAEQTAFYDPAKDALLQSFIAQVKTLSLDVAGLQSLQEALQPEEEQRLHYALDALLDMRRELIREARLRL